MIKIRVEFYNKITDFMENYIETCAPYDLVLGKTKFVNEDLIYVAFFPVSDNLASYIIKTDPRLKYLFKKYVAHFIAITA